MKKTVIVLAVIFAITACKQQKTEGFVINGTIKGNAENAEVKIFDAMDRYETAIDSTVIVDGKFQLKGKVEEPGLYRLKIFLADTTLGENERNLSSRFYLENSEITFEADAATMPSFFYNPQRTGIPVVVGSATEDLSEKFKAGQKEIVDRLRELNGKIMSEYHLPSFENKEDVEAGIRYQTEMDELYKQRDAYILNFVKENTDSPVALDQVLYWLYDNSKTVAEWNEIQAILTPVWKGSKRFEDINTQIEDKKKMAKGEIFPDAEFLNEKGEKLMLSSVLPKGKYVLVEFWASWCGPCRAEIPHLVKVKKKYPEFEIVSISIDEKDADWRKALAEEKMTWLQLNNPEGFEGSTKKVYGIMGIPAGFVLDPEGRILQGSVRGVKLDKILFDTYGQ